MSLSPEELALHRQLIAVFNEYIKYNLRLEDKGFYVDTKRTRKALRKLIDVAYLRWKEIDLNRKNIDEVPTMGKEAFRDIVRKNKKAKDKAQSKPQDGDDTST
jgi:hypothetical protein